MQVLIKIATLQGLFIEQEIYMALIPTTDGEVGIMAEHAPFIFKLDNGIVQLFESETRIKEKIFILGGFAQMHENKIDILTNKILKLKDLDIKHAREQIPLLENKLLNSEDEEAVNSIQKELGLYRKILEVTQLQ